MGAPGDLFAQERRGGRSHRLGSLEQSFMTQINDGTMSIGPVRRFSDEAPGPAGLQMSSHRLAAIIDLNHVTRDAQVHALADQTIGHGVVAALELDVVVKKHLGPLPSGVLVGALRQRSQRGLIESPESAAPGPSLAREGSVVIAFQLHTQRLVKIGETEEALMTQWR